MNKKILHLCTVALAVLTVGIAMVSCGEKKFTIKGDIADASDQSLLLEKADFYGRWIVIDSTRTSKDGKFAISQQAPASPEIYRLRFDDRFIYFPVDSTETVTLTTTASNYGHDYTLGGSEQARLLGEFEQRLQKLNFSDSTAVENFKRAVYADYLQEARGSILSYYVLTKIVGDKPLYDPESKNDAKYYGAVATAFEQYRPDDPHVGMLRDVTVQAHKKRNAESGVKRVVEANELNMVEIELPDENGDNIRLSDLTDQGVQTLVVFSMMNEPESPAFNKQLAEIKDAYGVRLNIYHISFDTDQYAWREAAANLPWTTVSDPGGQTSDAIVSYNVGTLPTFFIYNSRGDLAARASNFKEVRDELAKNP